MRRRLVIAGIAVVVLLLAAAGGLTYLLSSHHAPGAFALSSPAASGASGGLAGSWKITKGSEVGYRVKEKFINQPSTTEAVARTEQVTGGLSVQLAGGSYVATSIDFKADLSTLVSQDKYATYQVYQRDFFIRRIYLQTDLYPNAEFRSTSVSVASSLVPGPAKLDVTGMLTVHGVTKSVTTSLQVQLTGQVIEVVGSISVDMHDFNVDPPDISFTKAESGVLIEYHLLLQHA